MLTEEERKRRRQGKIEIYNEYVQKYREGDVFYHVTLKERAMSLLSNGFDPLKIGSGGGSQGGIGFSATWTDLDAWDWGRKIWGNLGLLDVVRVTLPGIKLATHQQVEDNSPGIRQYGLDNGYLVPEGEGVEPTEKLIALLPTDPFASAGWTLTGLYLRYIGFDGYMVGGDEIVIMNFAILGSDAFSLV